MNKGKSKRTKDVPCLLLLLITRSISSLPFFLCFLHPSSFTLAPHSRKTIGTMCVRCSAGVPHPFLFSFPLWRSASRQVRDLAEELPYWVDRHYAILFSSFLLTLG